MNTAKKMPKSRLESELVLCYHLNKGAMINKSSKNCRKKSRCYIFTNHLNNNNKCSKMYKSSKNWKLNGDDDYCGVSYTELLELESLLRQGFCSVEEQRVKALDELRVAQATECDLMGNEWVSKTEEEDFGYHWALGKRRRALRLKARELRLSAGPQEHSRDPDIRKEVIDSLKSEKERLRLWNQRMTGKEIDGMGCHELRVFSLDIQRGLANVRDKIQRNENYVIQVTKHANGVYIFINVRVHDIVKLSSSSSLTFFFCHQGNIILSPITTVANLGLVLLGSWKGKSMLRDHRIRFTRESLVVTIYLL
ncbi:unnamed protein product [Thlaspi arvense]|uniref:Uncharacterized protein n=1 Tax=Thlaspi arvense TaxID=13288 RepID=A0AAU9S5T3_THLAR|nr:unnamed protein product [Thlaspi arvense]